MPAQAEGVAAGLIKLREGEEQSRELAVKSICDYFRVWLWHRATGELRDRLEGE